VPGGIIWEQQFSTIAAWRAHVHWEEAAAPGRYLPVRNPVKNNDA
jgi:hypothetical protein